MSHFVHMEPSEKIFNTGIVNQYCHQCARNPSKIYDIHIFMSDQLIILNKTGNQH